MTDEPVFWRDMTHEQKGAILLAHHEGKVIEWTGKGGSTFSRSTAKGFTPVWSNDHAYRVRPDTTLAEALDAQPGFTADDLRRAWELCRDAAANEIDCGGCAHCMDPTNCWRDAANDVRALTPPADLADKVKEDRDDG